MTILLLPLQESGPNFIPVTPGSSCCLTHSISWKATHPGPTLFLERLTLLNSQPKSSPYLPSPPGHSVFQKTRLLAYLGGVWYVSKYGISKTNRYIIPYLSRVTADEKGQICQNCWNKIAYIYDQSVPMGAAEIYRTSCSQITCRVAGVVTLLFLKIVLSKFLFHPVLCGHKHFILPHHET